MTEEKDIYKELPSEDDDVLLEQLGRFARRLAAEEDDLDERLLRLQNGTLSEGERSEWLAVMSEQERLDYETFRPLDGDFKTRVLSQLRAEQSSARQFRGESAEEEGEPGRRTGPEDSAEVPLPFRRRRFPLRPILALAAGLFVATVGLWLLPGVLGPGLAGELPGYVASFSDSRSDTRGSGEELSGSVPELFIGDRFRLTLRPEKDLAPGVEIAFYLADAEGTLRPWLSESDYERSSTGSILVDGILGEDFEVEPGAYQLVFLYGEGASLPEPSTLAELRRMLPDPAAGLSEPPAWRSLTVPFKIALPPLASGELEVLYAGCFELWIEAPGEAFCVPFEELSIWARVAPGKSLEILLDGEPIRDGGRPMDGGRRFSVPMATDGLELLSRQLQIHASGTLSFELNLRSMDEPEWLSAARRQGVGGEVEEARRLLVSRLEDGPKGRIQSLLARLPGTPEDARKDWLDKAFAEHRATGRLAAMSRDFGMLAYLDFSSRQFSSLRRRLESLGSYHGQLPAEALFHVLYYRGLLENDLGNARGALEAIERAIRVAERTGLEVSLARATGEKALLLQRLGRGGEASELFASLKSASFPSPCERGRWLNNHAWSLILTGGNDPMPLLEKGLELVEEYGCDGRLRLNLDLNRALAHVLAGRVFEAEGALAEVRESDHGSSLHDLWRLDIEARLHMGAGRFDDAVALYRDLEEYAEIAIEPMARWHARVQRAEAFEALGDLEKALDELEDADLVVDAEGLEVPLGAGRDHFLADRELSAQRRIDLLLRLGREHEAFEVARRSRVRALETLRQGHRLAHLDAEQQRSWDLQIGRYLGLRSEIEKKAGQIWQLSQESGRAAEGQLEEDRNRAFAALDRAYRVLAWRPGDLPPFSEGEGVLLFHPLEDGWVGFGAGPGPGELVSHRIEPGAVDVGDLTSLSQRLLEPFRSLIDRSGRLKILPHGVLRSVDFHALPWRDGVLLDAAPVVYGLDLEFTGSGRGEGALILSDARGDLPAARAEATAVAAALSDASDVVRLDGDAATLPEVLLRLPGVALFHVAGHSQTEGDFAWQSAILLADEGRLALGDILALENAPIDVVLSSCESGRSVGSKGFGLGLAQAFLIAGSSRVVASTRPVGDAASSELFRLFYEYQGDVAERLRQAQLAWRSSDPSADWPSYRLLVP